MLDRVLKTLHGMCVHCAAIVMLYTHSIGNQLSNVMVVFRMRDRVPSARYSPVCNVLRLWRIWLIPISWLSGSWKAMAGRMSIRRYLKAD